MGKIRELLLDFTELDDELAHTQRIREYGLSLLEKVCNTFDIESDSIHTPGFLILKYAFLNGHCGIAKLNDGKYHVGMGEYVGTKLDTDGLLDRYLITFENGETFEGEVNKDVVVLWWNNLKHGQFNLLRWYANMLADTDLSMKYNIKYTRVCPIPIVNTDIEKKSIEEVIKNLFKGKLSIFKRSGARDLLKTDGTVKDTLDLTQPQASAYMQHLSRFHDELIQRVCLEFGVYVSVRDKGAQLNNAELGAFSDYCAISSDDTLRQLEKWRDKCKEVFNINIEVKPKAFIYTEDDVKANEDFNENVSRETFGETLESEGENGKSETDVEE